MFWREREAISVGPVLLRSALLTERWERPFALPTELRFFLLAVEAAVVLRPLA